MSLPRFSTVFSLVLVLLTGCNPLTPPAVSATGSAQLSLSSLAALPADVSRVTVTVSAADMSSRSADLVQTNGEYGGVISDLPAGNNRTFLAQAFTSSNTLRYEGRAEGVTITAGATSLVNITLQDVSAPPPFSNEAPIIESLVANPATVAPGGTVSLTVSARDPNTGDSISYAWTASAGTFSSATQASITWTAPSTQGPVTLTITVSDGRGASASQRLTLPVAFPPGTGDVKVGFNSAPRVVTLTSSQSALDVGQQTSLAVSATDADGDNLSYQWAATCAGSFTGATTASATFTPSALPTAACNNCQLSVMVKDGRGGQNTGGLAVCVTKDPYLAPPSITRAYQSSSTATAGQAITFEVGASDPSAATLSFSWATSVGTLGTATSDASRSRAVWTAPTCASSVTTPIITATVSNTRNQKTMWSFTVTGLPTCVPAKWTATGAMSTRRVLHTATLLPNGKVLVTGGTLNGYSSSDILASAELYDPAKGTWSLTGSMAVKRYEHTATLLPNGKVLVAGGSNGSQAQSTAELYDPATGTWSATGSMVGKRYEHHAVLLANGKVLIAAGDTSNMGAELYDPATGTWKSTGDTVAYRILFASALLADGRMLLVGGITSSSTSQAELYDPATGTWSATGSMGTARSRYAASLLSSGKVLVAGGYDSSTWATAELYDPATGTWSPTGSMLDARLQHTATQLSSGKVLIAGGSRDYNSLATAELYDPATGTWSATSALTAPRALQTATVLANGKVLVVGGYIASGPLATADVYDPGS